MQLLPIDNDLIGQIVSQYSGMIVRIAFQRVGNRADAEDVMQDVFVAMLKQATFTSQEHLKAWLIRATIHKSSDYLRKAFRKHRADFHDNHAATDRQNILFHELQRLPPQDRDVLYLFYYEGYSAQEIAKLLKQKEGAIFMRLSRARKKLKSILEE